jgi:hypothetical protein
MVRYLFGFGGPPPPDHFVLDHNASSDATISETGAVTGNS